MAEGKILTVEQKQACDEIAGLIDGYKAETPVTIQLHDKTATINMQMVKAQDIPFGPQKKFYKVFFEKKTPKGMLQIVITDLAAKATQNNYNRNIEALIITGTIDEDLRKKLGEQLYSAMYFAGYKNYINREPKLASIDKNKSDLVR